MKIKNINTAADFYAATRKNGDAQRYPYAVDAVAYYIWGDDDRMNLVKMLARGEYGHNRDNCLADDTELSALMLDYENSWGENMEYLNNQIANIQLVCGLKVSDVF